MSMILDQSRLARARRMYSTRRVDPSFAQLLLSDEDLAERGLRSGDVALARVDRIGHHKKAELTTGRRARMFPGDELIISLGARYAPDQYEAKTPEALGPCHLAAAGGVAGKIVAVHDRIIRPTEITLIGLLGDRRGKPLNLMDFAIAPRTTGRVPAILAAGTSMNAGKTTSAAGLIHGLTRAGLRVGALKITGTGAGGDMWHYEDAGAAVTLDFTDAGHASTYLQPLEALEAAALNLMGAIEEEACDIAVIEIADGLCQRETAALLNGAVLRSIAPTVLFTAREAMGAAHGVGWLRQRGYDVIGVSGLLTRSPLATREAAETAEAPVFLLDDLQHPTCAAEMAKRARRAMASSVRPFLAVEAVS